MTRLFSNISVIIPTYKNTEYTQKCIESLLRTSKYVDEIIIIENDPEGSTVKLIQEKNYPCKFIWNKENIGVSKSWNLGLKESKNNFVAISNNDIEMITENWDEILFQELKKNEKYVIMCPWPTSSEKQLLEDGQPFNGINGSFFVVNKEKVRETDNFKTKNQYVDEAFTPAYWEDCDLLLQIRILGYEAGVTPRINCVHYCNQTAGKLLPRDKGMHNPYWRNLDYFNKKYNVRIADWFEVYMSNIQDERTHERLI